MSTTLHEAQTDAIPIAKHAARPVIPRIIRTLRRTHHPRLDRPHRVAQHRRSAAGRGREDALGFDEPRRRAISDRDQARRRGVRRVQVQQLGDDRVGGPESARRRGPRLLRPDRQKAHADTKHVEHVQDFWSDPLTGAGAQSNDGKAAYVQVYLAGNQGEALANESVEAVQSIVRSVPAPNGLKAYVTGPAALIGGPEHRRRPQPAGDRGRRHS